MHSEQEKFNQIELAAKLPGGGWARNHFARLDDADAIAAWREQFENRDVYASICSFEKPSRDGEYRCSFCLDLDAEDLKVARSETLKACDLLMERLEIPPESIQLFLSGWKGFHLIVSLSVFGDPDYPHALSVWRAWAVSLTRAGIKHLDLGIYQPSRVLRLPNSINTKSGLYKVAIDYKELKDLGLSYVLEEAKTPRGRNVSGLPEFSPKAAAQFRKAMDWVERHKRTTNTLRPASVGEFRHGWRVPPCIRRLESATLPDGIRHQSYLDLARFYAWVGMHPLEAEGRIKEIDERHPIKDPDCISRAVKFGIEHPGFPGCRNEILRQYCEPERCFRMKRVYRPKGRF